MDNAVPDKVHWFSIVNSLLIVLFLTVMVAMIMVRNLHRDIVRYNRVLSDEEKAEDREESAELHSAAMKLYSEYVESTGVQPCTYC